MVQHLTERVAAAQPRTWVRTVLALTCSVRRTVGVDGALGPAGHIGVTKVVWDALAGGRAVAVSRAAGILPAW